jgi:hypothetical protein
MVLDMTNQRFNNDFNSSMISYNRFKDSLKKIKKERSSIDSAIRTFHEFKKEFEYLRNNLTEKDFKEHQKVNNLVSQINKNIDKFLDIR